MIVRNIRAAAMAVAAVLLCGLSACEVNVPGPAAAAPPVIIQQPPSSGTGAVVVQPNRY